MRAWKPEADQDAEGDTLMNAPRPKEKKAKEKARFKPY